MTTLETYFRLGDNPGSYAVQDSSGNGNTGSLINGVLGEPTFGATGVFTYDPDGALDLTAGQNASNGGISTTDYTTEPPTAHDVLAEASDWSVEMWFQWTGATTIPTPAIVPPGLTTLITHPAGFPGGNSVALAPASVTFSSAYAAIGDLAIFGAVILSPTLTITELTGITSDSWTLLARNQDAVNGYCVDLWTSTATSTAAPDTLAVTYSDTVGVGAYVYTDSLTVGQGANTIWSFPTFGVNQSNTNVTTAAYPALNADAGTNPQAYWGIAGCSNTMLGGSSSGFTYVDIGHSEIAYNLDAFSGDNPYSPTSSTDSGTFVTVGMIVEASISTAASTAAVPNATMVHIAGPNAFEPFTAYELQIGFVEVPSNIPGQTSAITNAVVEAFDGVDEYNVFSYASNPFDGGWHHLVRCNSNAFPYLDGKPPLSYTLNQSIGANPTGFYFGTGPDGMGLDPNSGQSTLSTTAQPFTGILDEVAMYTGTLTPTQITNHYNVAKWFEQQEYGAADGAASVARFNKVLAVCGIDPTVILRVPYTWGILLYAESDTTITTSGLNYEQTTSQTEDGIIFQGPDGYLYAYSGRYQYLNPTSTTSQALFSDNNDSPYYYDGPSLAIAGDDVDLWNTVQVQSGIPATATTAQIEIGLLQSWGPPQSQALAQSASVYANRTLQGLTSLQMARDSDALALAQYLSSLFGKPIERVTQITINAQGNGGANISQMLQRGLWQRITVSYQGQTEGPPFQQDSLIENISHSVNMDIPEWTATFATSPYEILLPAFYMDSSATDGTDVLIY